MRLSDEPIEKAQQLTARGNGACKVHNYAC